MKYQKIIDQIKRIGPNRMINYMALVKSYYSSATIREVASSHPNGFNRVPAGWEKAINWEEPRTLTKEQWIEKYSFVRLLDHMAADIERSK